MRFTQAEVQQLGTWFGPPAPVVVARAHTAAGQSIANVTSTIINFGTVTFDTHGRLTTGAAWKFTAALAGYYQVTATILFDATATWAAGEVGDIGLYKTGVFDSELDRKDNFSGATAQYMLLSGSGVVSLVAGDYIDVRAYQASGATLALFANGAYNHVSIMRL